MKDIVILGSTGSIGTQTLDVISAYPDKYRVKGLACARNTDLLLQQIKKFSPSYVAVADEKAASELKSKTDVNVLTGREGIMTLAGLGADIVVNALVGIEGLQPTLKAIGCGSNIALANKETLVTGGDLVMDYAKKRNVSILPVDSEHSAIWQCLKGDKDCSRIILTASGGAFRGYTHEMLENVTAADALRHPTWNMGIKVTIDSATLMNKGFEVIEAMHLFNKSADDIDVVIHKQSIIHSLVRFGDGSLLAQMSYPDMKLPIQVALEYPERGNTDFSPLDLYGLDLTFDKPDYDTFPCLKIAYECARKGGIYPVILNAADEILVEYFYRGIIKFYDIPYYIYKAVDELGKVSFDGSLEAVLNADRLTRDRVRTYFGER